MTGMRGKSAVPRLRFKGCEGEWKDFELSEYFVLRNESNESGAVKEILSVLKDIGVILYSEKGNVGNRAKDDVTHYKIAHKGDIVLNSMNVIIGSVGVSQYDGCISPVYYALAPKMNCCPEYFGYWFWRKETQKLLAAQACGMMEIRRKISERDLLAISRPTPPLPEQKYIGKFLSSVDQMLMSSSSHLTSLRQLKRAMLVKMFPRPGQCVPEIRFRGFDGKWEEKRLSLCMVSKDVRQKPSALAPLMAFTSQGGVTEKGERYDRSSLIKNANKLYKRTDYDDFIYSSNNLDVGSIGLNKYGSAVISDVYEVFECIRGVVDPDCLNEIIRQKESIKKILVYRQGCLYGQYRIYADDFLSVKILVPGCLDEQRKIGVFFRNLDKLIGAAEKKVAKLRQVKASLLERMFV